MWSTPSLLLLLGALWNRVVVPVRVPSMSQIELFENYLYSIGPCTKKTPTINSLWVLHYTLSSSRTPIVNLPWGKVRNTQNTLCWVAYTEVYLLLAFLVVIEERENSMKCADCFRWTERDKPSQDVRGRHGPWYYPSHFCCSSCTWLLGVPSSYLCDGCGTSSWSSPRMATVIFGLFSHLQLTFFSCFLSHISFNSFSVWVSSSESVSSFNLGICCFHDLDLGNL